MNILKLKLSKIDKLDCSRDNRLFYALVITLNSIILTSKSILDENPEVFRLVYSQHVKNYIPTIKNYSGTLTSMPTLFCTGQFSKEFIPLYETILNLKEGIDHENDDAYGGANPSLTDEDIKNILNRLEAKFQILLMKLLK